MLAESAGESLGQHLRARLDFALRPTLRIELISAKAMASSPRKKVALRGDGEALIETFRHFPGALEVAGWLIAGWIDSQQELLGRILRDEKAIHTNFLRGSGVFCVTAICPGWSDPHNGGRSVTFLEFGKTGRVVYKPRPCDGEQLWFNALRWLNLRGIAHSLRIPKLLARKKYSWMEQVRPRECNSFAAVREFYFRWGAQAALAQLLHACDLHRENWLAIGKQPILVDAELIGHTKCGSLPALLETGLLPLTRRDRVGAYRGIAPFDAAALTEPPRTCWPSMKGTAQAPVKYINDLVGGFRAVHHILADRRVATQFFDEVISPMNRRRAHRTLFRSTAEYVWLLGVSLQPRLMAGLGKRRRWLQRECCGTGSTRAIALAEAHSLFRCDVPKFEARNKAIPRPQFLAAVVELKASERLLRRRLLLGTH